MMISARLPASEQVSRAETDDIRVILRPNIVSGDPETFVQELADALRTLGGEVRGSRRAEPERLLTAKGVPCRGDLRHVAARSSATGAPGQESVASSPQSDVDAIARQDRPRTANS